MPGCANVAPAPPPALAAHLTVNNLTDYEWRIALSRASGESAGDYRIKARSSFDLDLAGGDYAIDQAALTKDPGAGLARRITVSLAPGRSYRWQLVTLLSDPAGTAASP